MTDQRPPFGPQGPHAPQGPYTPQGPYVPQAPQPAPWQPAAPRPADISQYAAPRPRRSLVAALIAGVVLVALAFLFVFQGGLRTPAATPSPTASAARPSTPGLPFAMPLDPDATGTWEIVEREWSTTGVSVRVRVHANTGTISYAFSAFAAGSAETTNARPGTRTPELGSGVLEAGESVDGWVFLPIPRGDATLFLTTAAGRAYSAQQITA